MQMLQLLHTTNTLCDLSADQAVATPSSTSTTSRAQQQQQQQQDEDDGLFAAALQNVMARAQVTTSDSEVLKACTSLWKTQTSSQLPNSPSCWLTNAFARLGQPQLSPVCLQQQSTSAPAGSNSDKAAEAVSRHGQGWMSAVAGRFFRSFLLDHYQQQQQQQQHSASSSTSGSPSTGLSAPAVPLPDHAAAWLRDAQLKRGFNLVVDPVLTWQSCWAGLATGLYFVARRFDDLESLRRKKQIKLVAREHRQERQERKAKQEQSQLEQKQGAADSGKQQLQRKLFGGGAASSSSSSEDGDDNRDDGTEGRGGKAGKVLEVSSDEDSQQADAGRCLLCAAEEAVGGPAQLGRSTNSSSSSSSGSAGLYGQFPVSWSDPFMMRRLLWDLLGKIKPTAQAWFKKHTRLCPHRLSITLWQMVVMSLARHIWAPPGRWGFEAQAQMALLLPPSVASASKLARDDPAAAAVRQTYACSLNVAAAHKSALHSSAAVVSMQVLLALDPHGARLQPRPELLYYTPSGFHAAVSKTLMQAMQLPLPPHGAASGASSASTAAGSQDQQQLQQQDCQTGQGLKPPTEMGQQQSYLQAWSGVAFPAYYVWWHIGLLAYHQEQQLQAQAQQLQQQLQQQMLSLRQQVRKGMGSAAAEGSKHKGSRQQQQQHQDEEQQQQGHRKQQQLGRRGGRTASDTGELSETQLLLEPAAAKLSGVAAAAAASTTPPQEVMQTSTVLLQPAASSSSSSGGSAGLPANMAELYSDPNAR